ncbi:hypothetical protein GCM10010329_63620 [Streptomyces spiroverticillatus]|uniref:Uncharacterized protein n=1 Tax=Streptomyces finlayi TaxID=67296 RepID=A0A919CDH5_9ACTN|nr:hypothetical protein GCM10010329_63620 [Streptomyces spiroverticillatus]GHD11037.1 hypothetical protein GCM10010334_66930 [Streptomyces finlayi]
MAPGEAGKWPRAVAGRRVDGWGRREVVGLVPGSVAGWVGVSFVVTGAFGRSRWQGAPTSMGLSAWARRPVVRDGLWFKPVAEVVGWKRRGGAGARRASEKGA